jgi:anti-sigma factor RsiW
MDDNRLVGGLWCSQVLAGLSEYLDGELNPETVAMVEQHLTGCSNCQRFGADMAAMLGSVSNLPTDIPPDTSVRLKQALSALG